MTKSQPTKEKLQQTLVDLERTEHQLRKATEDYAGTTYARNAEEMLKMLPELRADAEKQLAALDQS